MTKGAFIDQYTELGGGQRILVDLVKGFVDAGHEAITLFPGDGYVPSLMKQSGIQATRFSLPSMSAGKKSKADILRYIASVPRSARSIERALSGQGVDFLYVNGPRAMLAGVRVAKKLRIPMVAAVHLIHEGPERRLLDWCFRRPQVKIVSFCSRFAQESFPGLGPKAVIVPNWIGPSFLSEPSTREQSRVVLNLNPEDVAIGVLGRITATKGQRLFLEAATPLLEESNARIFLAGSADFEDPAEYDELKEIGRPYGDKVKFLEAIPAIEFLDALDISVVPSIRPESFGLVAVESMARGVPVVATKLGGALDTVTEAVGYLVRPTAEDLRNGLRNLIDNPARRRQMGESGRHRAASQYNPEHLIPSAIATILKAVEQ